MPDAPVPAQVSLDRNALEAIRALQSDSAPDLLAQVVRLYLQSAPALIERLAAALTAGDIETVRTTAHSLKSSSSNLGAATLADMCKRLELAARAGSLSASLPDARAVEREYAVVRRLLQGEIGETGT